MELKVPQTEYDILQTLGDELRYVFITSSAKLVGVSDKREIIVKPMTEKKCERCWQYVDSVGKDSNYPTLCCRCVGNLFGVPEERKFA